MLSDDDMLDIEIGANLEVDLENWNRKLSLDTDLSKKAVESHSKFFKKTSSIAKENALRCHLATRAAKVDLSNIQETLHVSEIPLNSSCDVVRQVRLLEGNVNDLDEALLKTYPTSYFLKKC